MRVEAILAAAASPEPPPIADLMPELLPSEDVPEDLPWLLRLLPRADVYLQDEVEVALHPTLTRVWCRKGRRGQRLVEAPGNNAKEYGFGLSTGATAGSIGSGHPSARRRRCVPNCAARSHARRPVVGSPWCCWITWAPIRPRARGWCARCWRNCAVSWCWSTPHL